MRQQAVEPQRDTPTSCNPPDPHGEEEGSPAKSEKTENCDGVDGNNP